MASVGYGPMGISVPRYKIGPQAPNRPAWSEVTLVRDRNG